MDQLNSALDFLESKNDTVHAELIELLKSNQETRKQIQESQKDESAQKSKWAVPISTKQLYTPFHLLLFQKIYSNWKLDGGTDILYCFEGMAGEEREKRSRTCTVFRH